MNEQPDHFCLGSHSTRAPDPVQLTTWQTWAILLAAVLGAVVVVVGMFVGVVELAMRAGRWWSGT